MIEGTEQFYRSFGRRAADGLRGFLVSEEVSPSFLERLRIAKGVDPWVWGFAVIDRESGLVIGNVGFKAPPDDEGMVEIAYGIVPAFEGRGYATEATRELISFAFSDPHVRVVRAHTLPTTNASARVLTKNGFARIGEVVDPDDGLVWRWERTKPGLPMQVKQS